MDESFSQALDAIYEAALEPKLWPQALQAIADCFQDKGAVLIWRRDGGGYGTIFSPGLTEAQKDYDANWQQLDVRAARGFERSFAVSLEALTDRDVVTDAERESLPFYTEFLTRHGLAFFAAALIAPGPEISAGLSIQRAKGRLPYDAGELQRVAHLARHVEKSLRLSMRLFDAEDGNLGLREALSRIGVGVVALDAGFGVVFANAAAKASAALVDGPTPVLAPAARARIEQALAQAEANPRGEPSGVILERGEAGPPLTLHVLPVGDATAAAHDLLSRARTLVLTVESHGDGPPDPALVRDLLGLTLGEARVAALVGSGLSPRSAAERLGIAESTARTVLKRVFAKAGVSRQSELVALFGKRALR